MHPLTCSSVVVSNKKFNIYFNESETKILIRMLQNLSKPIKNTIKLCCFEHIIVFWLYVVLVPQLPLTLSRCHLWPCAWPCAWWSPPVWPAGRTTGTRNTRRSAAMASTWRGSRVTIATGRKTAAGRSHVAGRRGSGLTWPASGLVSSSHVHFHIILIVYRFESNSSWQAQ